MMTDQEIARAILQAGRHLTWRETEVLRWYADGGSDDWEDDDCDLEYPDRPEGGMQEHAHQILQRLATELAYEVAELIRRENQTISRRAVETHKRLHSQKD